MVDDYDFQQLLADVKDLEQVVSSLIDQDYGLLNRDEIREYAEAGMIKPFIGFKATREIKPVQLNLPLDYQYGVGYANTDKSPEPVMSYGLEHFGYGIRIASEFRVFTPDPSIATYIDPKNFDERLLRTVEGDCFIPPNSYALGVSVEKFDIPDDILCVVLGKSTYARCGAIVNVTPGEPGWEGHWTIEVSNSTPLPLKLYANEGIAQVLFFRGKKPSTNYASTKGKYMYQPKRVVVAKM
jgi:dCTP deaminase